MSVLIKELLISEEIPSGLDVCETYIPPDGSEVWLDDFEGSAAFTVNSVVMVIWDYGTANEKILWASKGAIEFNHSIQVLGSDGIKKIALCCSNGETGPLILSGFAKIRVIE